VYLDVSLQRFATVFPAVGSGNSAIELNLDELWRFSNARTGWMYVPSRASRPVADFFVRKNYRGERRDNFYTLYSNSMPPRLTVSPSLTPSASIRS
jgi:hypothetical protein